MLAAYLAMSEVDRLVAQVLDDQGRSWPLSGLMGPRLFEVTGWQAQGFVADQGHLYGWMIVYLCIDVVFVLCYTRVLSWLLGWVWPLKALFALDILENVAAAFYGRPSAAPTWCAYGLTFLTLLKWLAFAVVVAIIIRRLFDGRERCSPWRKTLKSIRRALYIHRFSLIPLAPLVLLGLISGPNILDQLPDIQRQWTDSPAGLGAGLAATVVLLLLSAGLFVLGRMRSEFARVRAEEPGSPGAETECEPAAHGAEATSEDKRPEPVLWIYLVGPALVLIGLIANGFTEIQWKRLGAFVAVPLAVFLLSWLVRKADRRGARPLRRALDAGDVPVIALTGDILAVLAVVIGGLALVRSFTAVLVLGPVTDRDTPLALSLALLLIGVGCATLGWRVAVTVINAVMSHSEYLAPRLTVGNPKAFSPSLAKIALGVWLLIFVALYLFPLAAARVGVIACVLLALTSLSLLMGSFVVIAQEGGAPDVLWRLGARAAPLSLLLFGAIALGSIWAGDIAVHGSRNLPSAGEAPPARSTLASAFTAWSAAPGCRVQAGAFTIRPLFLVAAEGGGIRAAYWTSASVDRIVKGTACTASSGLVSSGASGGAVGLTLARFAPLGTSSLQATEISEPTALAAASVGLFVRDIVFSASGVPAPPRGDGDVLAKLVATGNGRWADRAALMEAVWQTQASALDTRFLGTGGADRQPTGELVLNSTSVGTGCRTLVSQVSFSGTPPGTDCANVRQPVAGSVDLFGAYPPSAAEPNVDQHCVGPVVSSTAAMFASRFPFVTPSAVIGPCGDEVKGSDQLVDGGYAENTGIGTIVDLSPEWLPLVRAANAEQLRASTTPTLIVPVLIYLDNGTGSDVRPRTAETTEEPLVPLIGKLRAATQQSDTPTLLQRAATLIAPSSLWDVTTCSAPTRVSTPEQAEADAQAKAECDARLVTADQLVQQRRPYAAVVVHESTLPSIVAPLGWTLSRDSIRTMDRALDNQASMPCAATPGDLMCSRGFGSLADLFATLEGAK